MSWVFYLIAAVFFFLAGIGSPLIPGAVAWGLFFLALGLLVGGLPLPAWPKKE